MTKTIQMTIRAIALAVCMLPAQQVLADIAGPNSPTDAGTAQRTGAGGGTWSNPLNALQSNDQYAQIGLFSSRLTSNWLWVLRFGFNIPAGATIYSRYPDQKV